MNIIFILYNDFSCNSAVHVHGFANALVEKGHECCVVVPKNKKSPRKIFGENIQYLPIEFKEICPDCELFSDKKGPDIIHSWTPRENVRKISLILKNQYPKSQLIIHLEDNEEAILEANTKLPIKILRLIPDFILNHLLPEAMSHPVQYKKFLKLANGVTVIISTLLDFVPEGKKCMILWPVIDTDHFFYPRKKNDQLIEQYGLKKNDLVIVYTGNVHRANVEEVRELYMAVGLANREGLPVKLIRTGNDHCRLLKNNELWVKKYFIELGYIDRETLPDHLALADILIQPGQAGKFNDYRLPSKIPEFLAMGIPVAIPSSNIGRLLENNKDAFIMEKGNRREILSLIKKIYHDKSFANSMGKSGRQFAENNFSKLPMAEKLESFYLDISDWQK